MLDAADPSAWYNSHMVAIPLSEIQKDFPAYLRRVAEGEVFVITDHDRPVAELKPSGASFGGDFHIAASEYLKVRVADVRLPQRWQDEGVPAPSDDCRHSILELSHKLFESNGLLPAKVVASRQGGIYLEYRSTASDRTLGIEIDNELDAVAVVADAHGTLASAPFESEDALRLLRLFFAGMETTAGDSRTPNA